MEDAGKTHRLRRSELRKIDPTFVKTVEAADPSLALAAAFVLITQLGLAVLIAPILPTWGMVALSATIGALFAHMTFLGMHEAVHDHFFPEEYQWANWVASFLVQAPLIIPVAVKFKEYHLWHHGRQATDEDPDEPSAFEERFFLSHILGRTAWACTQFVWYLLRPLFMAKPKFPWKTEDTLGVLTQIATLGSCAAFQYYWYGPTAWLSAVGAAASYLALSIVFAMGPSPFSAHFLIDHRPTSVGASYAQRTGKDDPSMALPSSIPAVPTFNYYGPWNVVSYFVGYHTEHHDFPKVSGFRLPLVHSRFQPVYARQPCSTSWLRSLWDFITLPYTYKQITRSADDLKKAAQESLAKEGGKCDFSAADAMAMGQELEESSGDEGAKDAPVSEKDAKGRTKAKAR